MTDWVKDTKRNELCPICDSDKSGYGSGFITCKWKDRDDNTYFSGNVCDKCWDEIVIPLLSGNLKNNDAMVKSIKYMIGTCNPYTVDSQSVKISK